MITLLLVDDHPAFRAGIRFVLSQCDDMKVVGEVGTGKAALEMLDALGPDLVLLDMELPDMTGMAVALEMQRRESTTRILPLSGHSEPEYVLGALEAGASGYLTKDTPIDTMVHAIRTVSNGGVYVSPKSAVELVRGRRRLLSDEDHRRQICIDLHRKGVTPRMFGVLRMAGQGLSNVEIGDQVNRSEHTIRNQVERIMELLDVHWRPALVAWAWRHSIQDIDEETFERFIGGA